MLEAMGTLVKEGTLARLEIVNVAAEPEVAREAGVRSVPWAQVGPFDLPGLHTLDELRHWVEMAQREDGMTAYFSDLLASGRRSEVAVQVRRKPGLLRHLVDLLGDADTGLSVRIGIMATFEELQGTGLLEPLVEPLAPLTMHPEARIRADACHALALTGSGEALGILRRCLDDSDPEVRSTAEDGIESLSDRG